MDPTELSQNQLYMQQIIILNTCTQDVKVPFPSEPILLPITVLFLYYIYRATLLISVIAMSQTDFFPSYFQPMSHTAPITNLKL